MFLGIKGQVKVIKAKPNEFETIYNNFKYRINATTIIESGERDKFWYYIYYNKKDEE